MLINEHTDISLTTLKAIKTERLWLVPYEEFHVERYHEWMKDENLQLLTASTPLSLPSEYAMQKSWRHDPNKLTFIICLVPSLSSSTSPPPSSIPPSPPQPKAQELEMIGDINLFLTPLDEDPEGLLGELELMIAIPEARSRGFGREALHAFLTYIHSHENEIMAEYAGASADPAHVTSVTNGADEMSEADRTKATRMTLLQLTAKISSTNAASIALFQSVGFRKVWESPNYFGEVEFVYEGKLGRAGEEGLWEEVEWPFV